MYIYIRTSSVSRVAAFVGNVMRNCDRLSTARLMRHPATSAARDCPRPFSVCEFDVGQDSGRMIPGPDDKVSLVHGAFSGIVSAFFSWPIIIDDDKVNRRLDGLARTCFGWLLHVVVAMHVVRDFRSDQTTTAWDWSIINRSNAVVSLKYALNIHVVSPVVLERSGRTRVTLTHPLTDKDNERGACACPRRKSHGRRKCYGN